MKRLTIVLTVAAVLLAGCADTDTPIEPPGPSAVILVSATETASFTAPSGVLAYAQADTLRRVVAYVDAVKAWEAEQAAAAAREQARRRVPRSTGSVPNASGDCYARAPEGFPPHVIDRESGGNPNAHNPSGAHGCAQLMPEHFLPGRACYGLSYDACWARLWDGGRGASNWSLTL